MQRKEVPSAPVTRDLYEAPGAAGGVASAHDRLDPPRRRRADRAGPRNPASPWSLTATEAAEGEQIGREETRERIRRWRERIWLSGQPWS